MCLILNQMTRSIVFNTKLKTFNLMIRSIWLGKCDIRFVLPTVNVISFFAFSEDLLAFTEAFLQRGYVNLVISVKVQSPYLGFKLICHM